MRRENMKKAISLAVSCLVIISVVIPAQAHRAAQSDDYMVELLLERGYPSDFLNTLIQPQIVDLYELVQEKNLYYLHTYRQQIQPHGNISSRQLSFDVTSSYTPVKIGDVTYFYEITIYVDYDWNQLPSVRGVDAITVNWDNSILTYNDDFMSKDYAHSQKQNRWITYKTWDRPNALSQGGLGINTYINFEEQISPSEWLSADGLRGSLSFSLTPEPRLSMSTAPGGNSTAIDGIYVHNANPLSGSLSFSYQGFGVSVSSGMLQDSIADTKRIEYTRVE
jgi:hypothetical protein